MSLEYKEDLEKAAQKAVFLFLINIFVLISLSGSYYIVDRKEEEFKMDNIKIVLEDIEENSYIVSLLGRFATVERIEDRTENGWDCVYSFPQYEITNIKNIDAIIETLKIVSLADWLRDIEGVDLW